ncbi:MAG: hypothetical protein JRF65_14485, partial [Deltaproteobacteria bacterium]|nr:hypothetical protein [Deltaproteobacteria bacterium]
EKGIEMVLMDPETIATFNNWAADYMDEMSEKDEFFAKVWKSQKDFGKRWYPYHKLYTLPHD